MQDVKKHDLIHIKKTKYREVIRAILCGPPWKEFTGTFGHPLIVFADKKIYFGKLQALFLALSSLEVYLHLGVQRSSGIWKLSATDVE